MRGTGRIATNNGMFDPSPWPIVAYPLWSRGELAGSPAESTTYAFLGVLLAIIAVPWGHIAKSYFTWPSKTNPA